MHDCSRLQDQIDILEDVIHFVADELRDLLHVYWPGRDRVQNLLADLYEVLDRHGYRGIIKLVGDVMPESRAPESKGWALDSSQGDFYFFKK